MNKSEFVLICKALGDINRIGIVEILCGGETCACKLLERFQITQPTLSHHMKILCECSLVTARKDGKWSHYSINIEIYEQLKGYISLWQPINGGDSKCN